MDDIKSKNQVEITPQVFERMVIHMGQDDQKWTFWSHWRTTDLRHHFRDVTHPWDNHK